MFKAADTSVEKAFEQKSDASLSFTLVTTNIQTTIRSNSLYQLVTDLLSQDLPAEVESKESVGPSILRDHQVDALVGNKAWLIHLNQKPKNVLFSGFEFQVSHLRVDGLFAKDNTLKAKRGFSACHYTAEYKNSATNELIIVHAYIGKNGIISYQVKRYKSEDDKIEGVGEDLLVNSTLEDMIRENAEPAVMLSAKLQKEKHHRYMKAEKKSYEIETKLNVVLQKILINSTHSRNRLSLKEEYDVLVHSFLAEVDIINGYNDDEIDKRGALLMQLYALMDRPVVAVNSEASVKMTELKEANESRVEPADLLDKMQIAGTEEYLSTKRKSKAELQLEQDAERAIVLITEVEAEMNTLQHLITQQNTLNTDELIARQTLKQALNLKLIELAFLSGMTPQNNAYLEGVAIKLNNIPALIESFKQAVALGELGHVTQLYPHVQNENLTPIFADLIFKKLVLSRGEELDKIIAIAEFFSENSNCYHEVIKVCDWIVICGDGFHYSLLFDAFRKDNYLAFKFMLEQGFDPNGIGTICEEVTASVMHAITYFAGRTTLKFAGTRYIKALLSFGALADNKTPDIASNIAEATTSIVEKKKAKKFFKKNKMQIKFGAQGTKFQAENEDFDSLRLKKMLSFDSALKMLCFKNQPEPKLLKRLAPKSNLSSLLSSLAFLINDSKVITRFAIGTDVQRFVFCFDAMGADLTYTKLLSSPDCNLRLMLNGIGNFENEIKEGNEIIIVNNNGAFVIFYRDRMDAEIANFSCNEDLKALLEDLPFNGELLVKNPESEKLYKRVYEEVRSKGGCTPVGLADKKYVTCIAYHTHSESAGTWCENIQILVNAIFVKHDEILERDPAQATAVESLLIEKAKATEDLCDKTNFYTAALYLQLLNPQFSAKNAEKIVQTLCYLGQAYFYHRFFDAVSRQRSEGNFLKAFLCCTTLACSQELRATPLFDFVTKRLIALGTLPEGFTLQANQTVTLHLNETSQALSLRLSDISDSKQPGGSPLMRAAQKHASQMPPLTTLAEAATKSAPTTTAATPPVALTEENTKGKKKKKKKR